MKDRLERVFYGRGEGCPGHRGGGGGCELDTPYMYDPAQKLGEEFCGENCNVGVGREKEVVRDAGCDVELVDVWDELGRCVEDGEEARTARIDRFGQLELDF